MQIIKREFLINRDIPGGMDIESAKYVVEIALCVGGTRVIDTGDTREDGLLKVRRRSEIESVATEDTEDRYVLSYGVLA